MTLRIDETIHSCSKAIQETTFSTASLDAENCPNACGVRFYLRAYEETRKLLKL